MCLRDVKNVPGRCWGSVEEVLVRCCRGVGEVSERKKRFGAAC